MTVETRKDIRLPGFDYSGEGAYFVTVCTRNRENLFGEIVGGDVLIAPRINLSRYGQIVERVISQMPAVCKYVIMPNHVHLLIKLEAQGSMSTSTPTGGLPSLVRFLKRQVTIGCGKSVWQRSYYDHIIRDDNDFMTRWNYIDANPARWREDEYFGG